MDAAEAYGADHDLRLVLDEGRTTLPLVVFVLG